MIRMVTAVRPGKGGWLPLEEEGEDVVTSGNALQPILYIGRINREAQYPHTFPARFCEGEISAERARILRLLADSPVPDAEKFWVGTVKLVHAIHGGLYGPPTLSTGARGLRIEKGEGFRLGKGGWVLLSLTPKKNRLLSQRMVGWGGVLSFVQPFHRCRDEVLKWWENLRVEVPGAQGLLPAPPPGSGQRAASIPGMHVRLLEHGS